MVEGKTLAIAIAVIGGIALLAIILFIIFKYAGTGRGWLDGIFGTVETQVAGVG